MCLCSRKVMPVYQKTNLYLCAKYARISACAKYVQNNIDKCKSIQSYKIVRPVAIIQKKILFFSMSFSLSLFLSSIYVFKHFFFQNSPWLSDRAHEKFPNLFKIVYVLETGHVMIQTTDKQHNYLSLYTLKNKHLNIF